MSRFAKRVTIEFLKSKIDQMMRWQSGDRVEIKEQQLIAAVGKDLKVEFDWENWCYRYEPIWPQLTGYCTLPNGLTFLGNLAGGDWEYPVWFCVYWDGKKLRAYIPTEGNPYNSQTKRAYGNDDEGDRLDILKRCPELKQWEEENDRAVECDDVERDYGLILKDLMERIEVRD